MISINATLVVQVIHIIVLIFILNRIMYRPLMKLAREREEYLGNSKKEIQELEEQAENLKLEFLEVQRKARKKASEEASEIREQGVNHVLERLEETKKDTSLIRDKAEKEAREEVEKTKPFLGNEAAGLAEEITESLIGRRITG